MQVRNPRNRCCWMKSLKFGLLLLLFTTGDTASEETAAILVKTGAPCLEKPFRVHQLVAAVERIVGRKQ